MTASPPYWKDSSVRSKNGTASSASGRSWNGATARSASEGWLRRSPVVVAVILVAAGFMGCGGVSGVIGPRTHALAVDPADYPHSESRWPDGQPITVECWGDAKHRSGLVRGAVTFRTRTGERYGWTAELSPEVLRNAPGVSSVNRVFPPIDFDAAYTAAIGRRVHDHSVVWQRGGGRWRQRERGNSALPKS